MRIDHEAFDRLMRLARRATSISNSKPSNTVITYYSEQWAIELTNILNKCSVIGESGNILRHPTDSD